jgi:signal transduction histidine kinase
LISGPEAAVIELVKNAYDADASFVSVKFVPPLVAGSGRIEVTDDGHGMTLEDIQEKWMEPATSSKVSTRRSPIKRRLMMGSKGIGRFAAAKLGRKMALNSVSERGGDRREVLIPELDWSIFAGDRYLSDISIDYLSQPSTLATGTTIEIVGLNEGWTATKISRLHLELRRLISPLQIADGDIEFKVYLDLSACTQETCGFDGEALLNATAPTHDETDSSRREAFEVIPFSLFTTSDYEVEGHFDEKGAFHGTFQIKRAAQKPEKIKLTVPLAADEESCGRVGVRLFLFDREADVIKETMRKAGFGELTAARARTVLDEMSGIAIYREGFRIRPYGDPQNDWLTLDKFRVQDPSLHIGHNQVAGYLTIEDQDKSDLIERSSREGLEENAAFARLKALIGDLLSKFVEPKRQLFRIKAGLSRSRSTTFAEVRGLSELNKVRKLVSTLEPSERQQAEKVIDQQSTLLAEKIDQLEERQRILEAKSSLGAILGEVLHEGAPEAAYIATTSARLLKTYPLLKTHGPKSTEVQEEYPNKLRMMQESGARLRSLFASLRPLAGGKRGAPQTFNPINQIQSSKELFDGHNIPIAIENPEGVHEVVGHPDDLATALINIIGNAIYWLEESQTPDPRVGIDVRLDGSEAVFEIEDNGPGIPDEFVESIFDVGFTLKRGGTGLGLNIAREALARSGASLGYHLDFKGGARFEIRFPTLGPRR